MTIRTQLLRLFDLAALARRVNRAQRRELIALLAARRGVRLWS